MKLTGGAWALLLGAVVAAISGTLAQPQADPGRGAWLISLILILRGLYKDPPRVATILFGWALVVLSIISNHYPIGGSSLYRVTLAMQIVACALFLFYDRLVKGSPRGKPTA